MLQIEYVDIRTLLPYKKNARKHTDSDIEQIVNSIRNYGFNDPIGVWGEKNIVVEGHGRLEAAKRLNLDEVPVIRLDHMSDKQRREYAIAHNRTAELSAWDADLLKLELSELDFSGIDLGFEFDLNLDGDDAEAAKEDDFDVEPPADPITKPGDIWILGRHRLMCGDSTNMDCVKQLTDGVLVDMLLTDPPYGVDYVGKTKDALKIDNDKLVGDDFIQFLKNAFNAANSVMKPGAVFYIWHADSKSYEFRKACHETGWEVRQCLIWEKNSLVLGRQDYQWQHEPCLYGWKEGASHLWASDRKQTTVLHFDKPARNGEHPTMKPVPLFDYQIKNNTKGGDIVLDLFGGSGTTIMACEQNGRTGYLMEYDPRYVDVIVKRWESFTGLKAERRSAADNQIL